MKTIGLDIGTTTICAVVADTGAESLRFSRTLPNTSALPGGAQGEKWQEPQVIVDICRSLLEEGTAAHPDAEGVGISGQMHGVVYLNSEGRPVGPLAIWQDGRGDVRVPGREISYAQELSRLTGYPMATGYGVTTAYADAKNGRIPREARWICTIGDYLAMELTGRKTPLVHISQAAGMGCVNLENGDFDRAVLEKIGFPTALLPEVTTAEPWAGWTEVNGVRLPVSVSMGDNQASVLGSVDAEANVLVNVGTGSQISVICDGLPQNWKDGSVRPFLFGKTLQNGSSLCGGYAYNLMKRFLEEVFALGGAEAPDNLYALMGQAAAKAYAGEKNGRMEADTRYRGTRANAALRGSFSGISEENFHPGHMILGVIRGIAGELFDFYEQGAQKSRGPVMVGSGNGIRKNPLMQQVIEDTLGMKLLIPALEEEAALGVALLAMYQTGRAGDWSEVSRLIRYNNCDKGENK